MPRGSITIEEMHAVVASGVAPKRKTGGRRYKLGERVFLRRLAMWSRHSRSTPRGVVPIPLKEEVVPREPRVVRETVKKKAPRSSTASKEKEVKEVTTEDSNIE